MSGTLFTSAVASELGDLPGEPVGIGLCDAMLGTAALIAARHPQHLIFVGTAGAFRAERVGSVVQAATVALGDAALALRLGYSPRHPPPLSTPGLAGIPSVAVTTSLAITTDPGLAAQHATTADVEHMEAFGFALACERAGVRWACVLGITNLVGPDAHAQWVLNRPSCEAAARAAARSAAR